MQPDLPEPQDDDVPDAAASPTPSQTESVPVAGAEVTGAPAAGGAERRRRRNRRRGKGGSKAGAVTGAVSGVVAVAGDSDAADALAGQQILAGSESESAPQRARAASSPRARGAKQTREGGGKSSRGANLKAPRTAAPNDAAAATDNLPGAIGDDHKLQKLLAEAGLGSRRDMEEAITAGRVSVNGKTATLGQRITRRDVVRVDAKPIRLKNDREAPEVLIYHKPPGEIVSQDDPEGRPTVFAGLPAPKSGRWVAVGRLDFNTEGLLILTNSGDLANRLMHPRYEVEREYSVRVVGELTDEQTDTLLDGVELDDGPARFMRLDEGEFSDEGPGVNRWYRVMIREGRNREVRRMFEKVGVMVSRLIRTRFGPISLPRGLRRGQSRPLTPLEVRDLLKDAPVGTAAARDGGSAEAQPNTKSGMPRGIGNGRGKARSAPGVRDGNVRAPAIRDGNVRAPAIRDGNVRAPAIRDGNVRVADAGPGNGKRPAGRGGKAADRVQPGSRRGKSVAARKPLAKGLGGNRSGKRGPIDRSSLTLDGRRAAKPGRRSVAYVPPPPPTPIITRRRSKLMIIPPEGSQES